MDEFLDQYLAIQKKLGKQMEQLSIDEYLDNCESENKVDILLETLQQIEQFDLDFEPENAVIVL